ncbi:MAG TPA: acylphosphatase [Acidimicrobiales bacterium]|nr:acylphosphatase [Acidimicrobiales bacterium]
MATSAGSTDPAATVRRRVVVAGAVQGVGFRLSCARRARAAALGGWVRNLSDGRVEAVFEGPVQAVEELVAWCRTGPPAARVMGVEIEEDVPRGERAFEVR